MTGARVAPLPEHAHGPRRRAGPHSVRGLRGPAAGRDQHARVPRDGQPVCDSFGSRQGLHAPAAASGRCRCLADGSAHFEIPGGLPMVLHLADDTESQADESAALAARGDDVRPRRVCAPGAPAARSSTTCAGAATARSAAGPSTSRSNPDFLTQASDVLAAGAARGRPHGAARRSAAASSAPRANP